MDRDHIPPMPVARCTPAGPVRLFCFPHAGGTSAAFRAWKWERRAGLDLRAVELPGRATRLGERPLRDMRELAADMCRGLETLLGDRYAFFGHSMGALLAFEVCRSLRRAGLPLPLCLFVSAHRAPHLPDSGRRMHNMPDDVLLAELARMEGTPGPVLEHAELMRIMLPAVRADFAACEAYRFIPDAPLPCPIRAYGGVDDTEVDPGELAAWSEHTAAGHSVLLLPGRHFYLQSAPGELIRDIRATLDVVTGAG